MRGAQTAVKHPTLGKIAMDDESHGWAVSDGYVVLTNDGGRSWRKATPESLRFFGMSSGLYSTNLYNFFGSHAWIVRDPMSKEEDTTVWHTADEGGTWTRGVLPLTEKWEKESRDILPAFPDVKHGLVIVTTYTNERDSHQTLYITADSGSTWRRAADISDELPGTPVNVSFRSKSEGLTITLDGPNKWSMHATTDGGLNWSPVAIPPEAYAGYIPWAQPPKFFGNDKKDGLLVVSFDTAEGARSFLYVTSDGGRTWSPNGKLSAGVNDIIFIDKDHGFHYTGKRTKLYATKDGGRTWSLQNDRLPDYPNQIGFTNAKHGWFVAARDNLYTTSDGGRTWQPKSNESN